MYTVVNQSKKRQPTPAFPPRKIPGTKVTWWATVQGVTKSWTGPTN